MNQKNNFKEGLHFLRENNYKKAVKYLELSYNTYYSPKKHEALFSALLLYIKHLKSNNLPTDMPLMKLESLISISETPEQVIGLAFSTITKPKLTKKFKLLALLFHPDKSFSSKDTFIKIHNAYNELQNSLESSKPQKYSEYQSKPQKYSEYQSNEYNSYSEYQSNEHNSYSEYQESHKDHNSYSQYQEFRKEMNNERYNYSTKYYGGGEVCCGINPFLVFSLFPMAMLFFLSIYSTFDIFSKNYSFQPTIMFNTAAVSSKYGISF